jgi:hypothetical protein
MSTLYKYVLIWLSPEDRNEASHPACGMPPWLEYIVVI